MNEQAEKRNMRVTLAVTMVEKAAVKLVCQMLRTDESNLLREHSMEWILKEAERMMKVAG